jgi:hypothetical protein
VFENISNATLFWQLIICPLLECTFCNPPIVLACREVVGEMRRTKARPNIKDTTRAFRVGHAAPLLSSRLDYWGPGFRRKAETLENWAGEDFVEKAWLIESPKEVHLLWLMDEKIRMCKDTK